MEGTVESGSVLGSIGGAEACQHEVDEKSLPEWDPRLGKVYRCTMCGARVFRQAMYHPAVGKRVHMSKKERRRRGRIDG